MPAGVLVIPDSVMHDGTTYPVASVEGHAFEGCVDLTSVTIPNSVTSIGASAFHNCSGLTTMTIGSGVTSIGDESFSGCSSLTSITIPSSVTSIGINAFYGCSGLNSIVVDSGNTVYDSRENCNALILTATNGLIQGCNNTVIPNSVTLIYSSAFRDCSGLTGSLSVPNSVTSIGYNAFWYCTGLTSVTIGNSVTSIGSGAFFGCSNLDTVYMMPLIPPLLEGTPLAFDGNASDRVFILNGCSYNNYYGVNNPNDNHWYYYRSALRRPIIDINVIVSSSDSTRGTAAVVLGPDNTIVRCDSTVVVQATTNYGYHFDHWSTGNAANPDTITLTGDSTITAYFLPNSYTITANSGDTTMGSVLGGGTPEYLDTISLTATANYGYHFTQWSDGNTCNPRTIVVTHDSIFTAQFTYNQYSITLCVDTSIHGNCTGGGSYNYLSNRIIRANANYGYHFTHWNDGVTDNPRDVLLTSDTAFTAYFDKNIYHVIGTTSQTARGYVTGSDTVFYLDTVVLMATANYGYHFQKWNDNNTDNPRAVVATGDITKSASFAYNQYTITLNVDTSIHGSCTGGGSYNYLSNRTIRANVNYGYHFTHWNDGDTNNPRTISLTQDTSFTAYYAPNRYTLTLQSNNNHGQVSGGGEYDYLDTVTITATAEAHYHLVDWSDGNTDNSRQYVITEDVSLTAYFAIDTHTVTVQVNDIARGMVQASGTDFVYGTPCTVTATAYSGYSFVGWSNGVQYNPYTFAVFQDISLTAIFEETQGINDVDVDDIVIQVSDGHIIVLGAEGIDMSIYDMMGRRIAYSNAAEEHDIPMPTAGVYLVKVGTLPARKVVVIR